MSPFHRSRTSWRLVVLLTTLIVISLVATSWVSNRVDEAQFSISCQSAKSNISQLEALAALEHRLGIPVDFTIPEVPPECDGR